MKKETLEYFTSREALDYLTCPYCNGEGRHLSQFDRKPTDVLKSFKNGEKVDLPITCRACRGTGYHSNGAMLLENFMETFKNPCLHNEVEDYLKRLTVYRLATRTIKIIQHMVINGIVFEFDYVAAETLVWRNLNKDQIISGVERMIEAKDYNSIVSFVLASSDYLCKELNEGAKEQDLDININIEKIMLAIFDLQQKGIYYGK